MYENIHCNHYFHLLLRKPYLLFLADVLSELPELRTNPAHPLVELAAVAALWVGSALGALEIRRLMRQNRDLTGRMRAASGAFLDLLKQEPVLDWTFLSPSALIQPGERTGKFRLGTDQLLVDAAGKSAISTEDFAIALVDELEKPAHRRRRFTVGY